MNVPESVLAPFGFIGIPTIEMTSDGVLDMIRAQVTDCMRLYVSFGYTPDEIVECAEDDAIELGASWASGFTAYEIGKPGVRVIHLDFSIPQSPESRTVKIYYTDEDQGG